MPRKQRAIEWTGVGHRRPVRLGAMLLLISIPIGAGLMLPALARAKSKADQINCLSNLTQIALAAHIYAGDHKEVFPPDFLSMSNELVSPKILFCAADKEHTRSTNWTQFDPRQNVSYELVGSGVTGSNAISTVIVRCPIHGNEAMRDGHVEQGRRPRR